MTREETKQAIQIMQAYLDGAEIEMCDRWLSCWDNSPNPAWSWGGYIYRVKPKPKLTLAPGRWYETNDGLVAKCEALGIAGFYTPNGRLILLRNILREVRVEAVE